MFHAGRHGPLPFVYMPPRNSNRAISMWSASVLFRFFDTAAIARVNSLSGSASRSWCITRDDPPDAVRPSSFKRTFTVPSFRLCAARLQRSFGGK
jgi:hypothetical protein